MSSGNIAVMASSGGRSSGVNRIGGPGSGCRSSSSSRVRMDVGIRDCSLGWARVFVVVGDGMERFTATLCVIMFLAGANFCVGSIFYDDVVIRIDPAGCKILRDSPLSEEIRSLLSGSDECWILNPVGFHPQRPHRVYLYSLIKG